MSAPEEIVREARRWISTPYRHQASLIGIGCDCLGLLRGVWRAVVGPEPEAPPPYAPDWAEAGGEEALLKAAIRHLVPVEGNAILPGRVLVFRWRENLPAKHCAIASDATHMIHAHDGAAIAEVAIGAWRRRLVATFRFPDGA